MDWIPGAARRQSRIARALDAGKAPDAYCLRELCTLYMVASYLYYERNESVMRDDSYDRLCAYLADHHDELEAAGVWGRHLIDHDALRAGTGYGMSGRYPPAIMSIAEAMIWTGED